MDYEFKFPAVTDDNAPDYCLVNGEESTPEWMVAHFGVDGEAEDYGDYVVVTDDTDHDSEITIIFTDLTISQLLAQGLMDNTIDVRISRSRFLVAPDALGFRVAPKQHIHTVYPKWRELVEFTQQLKAAIALEDLVLMED